MNVMLRSDAMPDVAVKSVVDWEYCDLSKIDRHIRTLLTARRWLKKEIELRKAATPAKTEKAK